MSECASEVYFSIHSNHHFVLVPKLRLGTAWSETLFRGSRFVRRTETDSYAKGVQLLSSGLRRARWDRQITARRHFFSIRGAVSGIDVIVLLLSAELGDIRG